MLSKNDNHEDEEVVYGSWEDEPAPLSKDERASLRAFVNRRRPDIPARRAGMHQR